jgi:3-hydroxybutyryl-CoA dehydrogenase
MRVENVGVVGCGLMGAGIAEVFARAGRQVRVYDVDQQAATRGADRIQRSLERALTAGKLSAADCQATSDRIAVGTDLDALAHVDLCVEAATENEPLKLQIFQELDARLSDGEAILATNTSSVPIMKLATATHRPGRVIGMHFFNPVPVLPLVELVPSLMTSDETREAVEALALDLGKTVIWSKDRAGFVVNALLVPFLLSAIRMFENGFATRDDIDAGLVQGCAHPMGPLRLCDLIGLDTVAAIADSLYLEFKEPLYAPPPLLLRMRDAGLLGTKSGRGFYEYAQ